MLSKEPRLLPKLGLQEGLQVKPAVRGIRNHCREKKRKGLAKNNFSPSRPAQNADIASHAWCHIYSPGREVVGNVPPLPCAGVC